MVFYQYQKIGLALYFAQAIRGFLLLTPSFSEKKIVVSSFLIK